MLKTNSCTVGAPQSPGSLLTTTISSSALQNASSIILPYATLLPTGTYLSKVVAVDEGVFKDKPYIDCTHELTAPDGEVRRVKFRFFAPTETDALFQKLAEYKLVGTVGEVLVGLEEDVVIAPRPSSSRYVYISHRMLATPTVTSPTSAKKSSLVSKRSYLGGKTHSSSNPSQRASLLEVDEDDEDDLSLDEDEE